MLATDQRYCLNCGTPRAEPRLDYRRALAPSDGGPAAGAPRAGDGAVQWSPLFVVLAIAALGVMLLLGVLIGKDDNEVTVTEVPASTTTTTTPTEAAPTETVPTTTTPPTTPSVPEGIGTAPQQGTGTTPSGSGGIGAQGGQRVKPGGTD